MTSKSIIRITISRVKDAVRGSNAGNYAVVFELCGTMSPEGVDLYDALDLGIALFDHSQSTTDDVPSMPVGTAPYMPPEQWTDSSTVDARADLFSLGCTLLKLLTGKTPKDLKYSHQANSTTLKLSVSDVRTEIPRAVDRLLGKLLSDKPDDRPKSASKVAEILRPWARGSNLPALVDRIHSGVGSCKSIIGLVH